MYYRLNIKYIIFIEKNVYMYVLKNINFLFFITCDIKTINQFDKILIHFHQTLNQSKVLYKISLIFFYYCLVFVNCNLIRFSVYK